LKIFTSGALSRCPVNLYPHVSILIRGTAHLEDRLYHDQAATSTRSSSCCHALTIHLYYHGYSVVRDRRGRTTQADASDVPAALHQLINTDEAMDDADAHTYTTTIIMHGEREVKTKDDDHGSLIGGAPAC